MNKQEYLKHLQRVIQQLHNCGASYRRTVKVHEVVKGGPVWDGEVEVFWLTGHPGAKRCFAWSRPGSARQELVVMLEGPQIIGPATAVRAALATRSFRQKSAAWQFFQQRQKCGLSLDWPMAAG